MRLLILSGLFLAASSLATAQELRFEAELLPDGSLDVRPVLPTESDSNGAASSWLAEPIGNQVYLWTDADGALKGILDSQGEAAQLPLLPGDSIETYATAGFNPLAFFLPSDDEIQQMMEELADKLFAAAKSRACAFVPLPETITPSVSLSLGVGFSGTATLEATWRSSELCPSSGG
ncbi:hypothetical protein [Pelagibacterium sp.]|uniref:hypothetical protein n=1 Tax=Pelagibacterium sp. TaxID=1967288 RepID=UPI003BACF356